MKLPQGYEPHEIPPDYYGKLWIEGQLRQFENAVAGHYINLLKQALEALESCDADAEEDGGRQWYHTKDVETAIKTIKQTLENQT